MKNSKVMQEQEKKEYLYSITKKPILEEILAGIFLGQRQQITNECITFADINKFSNKSSDKCLFIQLEKEL